MDHEPRSSAADVSRHPAGRRPVVLRPAARVVIVLALAAHALAVAAAVSAPPAEAHPQTACIDEFWGEPLVPPYCYDVAHDHPDPPPDPPDDGGGSDPGDGEPDPGDGKEGNERNPVNYDDEGNRIKHTPESCAELGLEHSGDACYDEGSDTDLDLPDKKRSCEDRKQWHKDGRCQVKGPEDDERSEGCPAGQAFYSTLGCQPPCGPGEVLSDGACHAVRPPPQAPPGGGAPPPECPVGYSGTPPDCVEGTPEIYVLPKTVAESDGTVDVIVTLSHRGTADATVDVSTSDGTATAGDDYTAVTGRSVTIAAGAQTATVSVAILDDTAYERGDETFTLTASNAAGGAVLGTDPTGDVTIVDDDLPTVSISPPATAAVEEGDVLEFAVTLTRPDGYTDAVTVDYAVASEATGAPLGQRCGRNRDWAVLNSDTTTVSWASGDSDAKTVVVAACTDGVHPEPDETVDVTLSDPTPEDVRLSSDTASGTIESRESYVPGLSLGCALRPGGDGWDLTFLFPMDNRFFYRWRVNGGGWKTGHYGWIDTRVTAVRTVTTSGVHTAEAQRGPGRGNNHYRGIPDKVSVVCEEPPTVSVYAVTVDESAGTADFEVRLSKASTSEVTVAATTADGTAHAAATPVAVAYVAARDALIADLDRSGMKYGPQDSFYRAQYGLAAQRARAAHSLDSSIPLGENDPNSLPLPNTPQGEQDLKDAIDALAVAAGVPQSMIDNPAATAIDYTAINTTATIAAGSLTATVQVPITDDTSPEPDETFTLTLSSPTYATLGTATATGTITDDDSQVTAGFGQASYSVAEGDSVTVTATLSADPHRTVVVPISHTPRGGATSADYSGVPASVTFNSGETSKTFSVAATDDTDSDAGESVRLSFGTLPTAVSAGAISEATVSITDDDGAVPTVSVSDVAVAEPAGTADFTVTLSAVSSVAVTVDVATSDGTATAGSDYTAVTRTVSIAAGSTSATVSVPITDDSVQESNETFTLTLSNPANAALGTASATGTIVDDESPPPIYR